MLPPTSMRRNRRYRHDDADAKTLPMSGKQTAWPPMSWQVISGAGALRLKV